VFIRQPNLAMQHNIKMQLSLCSSSPILANTYVISRFWYFGFYETLTGIEFQKKLVF